MGFLVFLDIEDDEQTRTVSTPSPPLFTLCSFTQFAFIHLRFKIYPFALLVPPSLPVLFILGKSPIVPASNHNRDSSVLSPTFFDTMSPSSDRTREEAAEAHAGLQLRPHEKNSPNFVPRSAHAHASQQAANVPSP